MAGNSIQDFIWSLGCDVTIVDIDTTVQEIKVNDITLSGVVVSEGLSVDVDHDRVNVMDLDVNVVVDGINSSIVESQVVTYDRIKGINNLSPESTYEKGFASSAKAAKEIYNLVTALGLKYDVLKSDVDKLEEAIENIEINPSDQDAPVGDSYWKLGIDGLLHSNYGIYVNGDAIFEGDTSSKGEGQDTPSAGGASKLKELNDVSLSSLAEGDVLVYDKDTDKWYNTPQSSIVPKLDDYAKKAWVSENFVNDAAITEVINLISSMWTIEGNKIVATKDVLIKANLLVEKDTSTGGSGSDTPVSGTVTGIKVSATETLTPNSAGVIDMVSTLASIDVSSQLANYALTDYVNTQIAIVNTALSGKQDAITSSNKLAYSLISDTPTIPTKTSQITEDTNLYFTEQRAVNAVEGLLTRYATKEQVSDELKDYASKDWVLEKGYISGIDSAMVTGALGYTPLSTSGGTLTGAIVVGAFTSFGVSGDTFYLGNPSYPVAIRSNGTTTINGNTLIHSGNIGSQSVDKANKLATARTIWGQSFDGTGNVDGKIYQDNKWIIGLHSDNNLYIGYDSKSIGNTLLFGTSVEFYNSIGSFTMLINNQGNVLIGTAKDSGYKLDVNGTTRIQTSSSDYYTALRMTNPWYGGSGKKYTDIVFESAVGYRGGVIRCGIDASYGEFDSMSFGWSDGGYADSFIPYVTIAAGGTTTINGNLVVAGDIVSY